MTRGIFFRDDGDGGYEPPRWSVGDPIGLGNYIGAPEIPSISEDDTEEVEERLKEVETVNQKMAKAETLSDEAWRLYGEGRYSEALVLINVALEKYSYIPNDWNRRAIILQTLERYLESDINYNIALSMEKDSNVFIKNRADMHRDWAFKCLDDGEFENALEKINLCIQTYDQMQEEFAKDDSLCLKGEILLNLNEYEISEKKIRLSEIRNPKDGNSSDDLNWIQISFDRFAILVENPAGDNPAVPVMDQEVELIKEPDNPHDSYAIRVELDGKKLGYLANSPRPMYGDAKSALDLYESFDEKITGTVFGMYYGSVVIRVNI